MGEISTRRDPWQVFFGFHSGFQVMGKSYGVERFKLLGVNSVKTPVIQDVATRTFVSQSRFFQLHKFRWPTGGVDPTWKKLILLEPKNGPFQSKKSGRNPRYSSLPENFSIFHGFTTPKIGKPWFFKRTGIFPHPNLWDCRRWFNPDASVQVARKRAIFHAGLGIWRLCWKTSILREGAGPCWWEYLELFKLLRNHSIQWAFRGACIACPVSSNSYIGFENRFASEN